MLTITKSIEFDAGHRVLGHKGKCRFAHGHRYKALVHLNGDLDELGMVVDYGDVKHVLGGWVDENLDHGFIVNAHDHEMVRTLSSLKASKMTVVPFNPTAENLAKYLTTTFRLMMPQVIGVTLYETPNSYASYTHDGQDVPRQ